MSYRVEVSPAAARDLKKLDPQARRRVQAAIELLAETPRPPAAKPLVNSGGSWRVRTGDYRIIYDIYDDRVLVLILSAGHRREVYR
ncbi:type II toxin-antitoxin system RelE/ParE family toxin [Leucobacter viscericola]|uniref:Type II toxin-antitoxin system RelE/ParE family toxin n=1 Tax=Leucobacter viscericola TaxID=2714935 RepID=A0A6G7XE38_9MICO|nr:type II toxin-antitoxin system RelE/ParE family toxin [Leucobacter viscericola]QIK62631.1 type II toxin-antitoxin system RelE/ParE family toxin [Leucobacter viscericola]